MEVGGNDPRKVSHLISQTQEEGMQPNLSSRRLFRLENPFAVRNGIWEDNR